MVSNPVKRYWTLEEYLAYEEASQVKHEFIDGEIYAMTGGTDKHSLIGMNLGAELRAQVRGKECRVYNSDLRIKISDSKYLYPDVTLLCGEARFADKKRLMLTNPTMLVEVMSASSANFDKGQKADYYRSLASLQAYLLLDQNRIFAQLYSRNENLWTLEEFDKDAEYITISVLGIRLSLAEIYLAVDFENEEEE